MPTVLKITLDAEEYRRQLAAVVAETRDAASTMGGASPGGTTEATVRTKVEGAEEVQDLKKNLDDLPVEKEVSVKTTAKEAAGDVKKLDGATASAGSTAKSFTGSFKSGLQSVRASLNDTTGGAKKMVESLLTGGGAIGIIIAGFASLVKLAKMAFDAVTEGHKEAAAAAEKQADDLRKISEANEEVRKTTDGYLSRLTELSSAEKLSNTQKQEALKLVRELSRTYGDLGISIDASSGKITGSTKRWSPNSSAIKTAVSRRKKRRSTNCGNPSKNSRGRSRMPDGTSSVM